MSVKVNNMSTPSGDALRQEIVENALVAGNPVKTVSKINVGAVSQLTADTSGNLQATAHLPVSQPTSTERILDLTGVGTTGALTQTFVGSATVTTATIAGYVRVNITNSGSGFTTGSYYLPVYTLV